MPATPTINVNSRSGTPVVLFAAAVGYLLGGTATAAAWAVVILFVGALLIGGAAAFVAAWLKDKPQA